VDKPLDDDDDDNEKIIHTFQVLTQQHQQNKQDGCTVQFGLLQLYHMKQEYPIWRPKWTFST
jgi:hypothetical protein